MNFIDRSVMKEFSSGCLEIPTNTWDARNSFDVGILQKSLR